MISAQDAGVFKAEIAPITTKGRKGTLQLYSLSHHRLEFRMGCLKAD
jgi:hypothetical protein